MFVDLRAIDVFAAARRIAGVARRTPLRRSAGLSRLAGGDVYLKLENEQLTGSFKIRGAFNTLAAMSDAERARGVVASSAGNHGLGVAYAARHFRTPATIYVPRTAPQVKKRGIAEQGATVNDDAPDYDEAHARAQRHAAEHGARFVDPCLGEHLVAGQGTVALEVVSELPTLASMVVCVGGGGLLGGIGSFLRRVAPHVRIVGAQGVTTDAMARSVAAGRVVHIPNAPTLADGLAGQVDEEAVDFGRHALDEIVLLSEDEIARTIAWLAREEGAVVEGAGAVAAGAVLHGKIARLPTPAVVTVSGGNIDREKHARIVREWAEASEATEARPA
ncbi:MAG TPA: pyridoxal-phosphate dependent enzyme [Gemmatimonadaceae bacterium]|nr:pyridoxal-phosphate dependent enzyme [Gemmatimonadaceae bacterium]